MGKNSKKEQERKKRKRREKRDQEKFRKSRIQYYSNKIKAEEEKKENKDENVRPCLPPRPVICSGLIRDRMASAIKEHDKKFGKGNNQGSSEFKRILKPSTHLTNVEKERERVWALHTASILKEGKIPKIADLPKSDGQDQK